MLYYLNQLMKVQLYKIEKGWSIEQIAMYFDLKSNAVFHAKSGTYIQDVSLAKKTSSAALRSNIDVEDFQIYMYMYVCTAG